MLRWFLNKPLSGRVSALALLLLLLPGKAPAAGETNTQAEPEIVRARWLMGTVLEIRLPGETPGADSLVETAFQEVSRVEAAASLWRPGTELAEVHARAAAGEPVVLSETLGSLVHEALEAAELTGGAYSPAVGALVETYDLRGGGRWPSEVEKRRAATLARPEGVHYDATTRTLRLGKGVTLDFDGIAKGFALDRAAAALRARGVDDALLNFGGQILSIGPPVGFAAREALVAASETQEGGSLRAPVRDASLSTSADSERVRTVAGREAGHLLDPRTGTFVRLPGSVSVLAPTGALADALSTAWAVEGPNGYSRSPDDSPLRRAGAVAFVLRSPDGKVETLSDRPFERLRTPARTVAASLPRP